MGVSTTHRNNLSMWIFIYSFSDTYYVWAACGQISKNEPIPLRKGIINLTRKSWEGAQHKNKYKESSMTFVTMTVQTELVS